ncbi:MAG: hypothetical protein WD768_19970 [Phycisphaeraceae bacterium]
MMNPRIFRKASAATLTALIALGGCAASEPSPPGTAPSSRPAAQPYTDSRLAEGGTNPIDAQADAYAKRIAAALAQQQNDGKQAVTPSAPKSGDGTIDWVDEPHLRSANPPKSSQPSANGATQANAANAPHKDETTTQAAPEHKIEQQATANPSHRTVSVDEAARHDLSRQDLLRLLHDRIRESNDPGLTKALSFAGLALADPDMQLRDSDIASLTPSQQQLVKEFHALLSALGRQITAGENVDRPNVMQRVNAIVGEQPMSIRAVKLCERVRGFGVYEELQSLSLLAGRDHPMVIYVEIDQFKTVQSTGDKPTHQVKLSQEVVLYNESDGLAVWQLPAEQIVDESRNRRRDFYVVQPTRLPARLTVGKYILKVRVRDLLGGTRDEMSVQINVVADPALVRPPVKAGAGNGS